jgi:uncharacterized membrane protein YqjE
MDAPASAGLTGTLRQLGASLLGAVHDRVELLGVELQEEKFRLVRLFLWISAVFFTGVMALTFASLTLVYLFWDTARLAVLGGLAAFYLGALLTLVVTLRRHLARQPRPFAATLQELQEDRACIRGTS